MRSVRRRGGARVAVLVLGAAMGLPGLAVRAQTKDPSAEVRAREVSFAKTMADRDFKAFLTFVSPEAIFFGQNGRTGACCTTRTRRSGRSPQRCASVSGSAPRMRRDPSSLGSSGEWRSVPAAELYVLDGQADEIRVFGNDGTFERAFGRKGEGPGEMKNPAGMALDATGILWVMDWGNARYDAFDPATGKATTQMLRQMRFAAFPWPGAFESGHRLLDEGLNSDGASAIIRLDRAFTLYDTLPLPQPSDDDLVWFTRGSWGMASMIHPFAPQPQRAPRPRGGIVPYLDEHARTMLPDALLGEGITYDMARYAHQRACEAIMLHRLPHPRRAPQLCRAPHEGRRRSLP